MTENTKIEQAKQDRTGPTVLTDAELDQVSGGAPGPPPRSGVVFIQEDADPAPEIIINRHRRDTL